MAGSAQQDTRKCARQPVALGNPDLVYTFPTASGKKLCSEALRSGRSSSALEFPEPLPHDGRIIFLRRPVVTKSSKTRWTNCAALKNRELCDERPEEFSSVQCPSHS